MDTIRTLACKLAPTAEQRAELDATLVAFADACNFIADVARQLHSTNKVKVQHAAYTDVRSRFGLLANLAIRAIARVCAALKVKSKAHSTFEPTSIDYDQRIFNFREWDWTFSLTLLHSRELIKASPGQKQKDLLRAASPKVATLEKSKTGAYFLRLTLRDIDRAQKTPPSLPTTETPHRRSEPSVAYLAGFFDGEGCVTMSYRVAREVPRLAVSITGSHLPTLEAFRDAFGGSVTPHQRRSNKQLFRWWMNHIEKCHAFLTAIEPYSMEKHEQILLALAWLNHRIAWRTTGRSAGFDAAFAQEVFTKLRDLKRESFNDDPKNPRLEDASSGSVKAAAL